jgi:hypothetical protein
MQLSAVPQQSWYQSYQWYQRLARLAEQQRCHWGCTKQADSALGSRSCQLGELHLVVGRKC